MTTEIPLPCDEALLAATLALMSAYAGPAADARIDAAAQRRLMARKIVSNLALLCGHPQLSPGLRQVAGTLHRHWSTLLAPAAVALH